MRVVSFIIREKDIVPELLCIEHPLQGLVLPHGPVLEGEDPRRAGLRIATRYSKLQTYSSIEKIQEEDGGALQFFKIVRNEPPGALGYWRHWLGDVEVKVRWMQLDGRVPLSEEPAKWLARHEALLLNL